jgi:hypothetical protein
MVLDPDRFDAATREIAPYLGRRALIGRVAASLLTVVGFAGHHAETQAGKGKKKKKKSHKDAKD